MKYHKFGRKSVDRLETCHPDLREIAFRALEICPYDFTIIHGHRGEDLQNALFDSGASKKQFPDSKHNAIGDGGLPASEAIDFGPWVSGGVPWNDTHIFAVVAGSFFAAAIELGYRLRWGGDWDGDGSTGDQTLMDWGHVEILL